MQAVMDQKRRLEKYKTKFAQNLTSYLANLFTHYGNFSAMDSSASFQGFRVVELVAMHRELAAYTQLTGWLKTMDNDSFNMLVKTYTSSIQKIYEKNIRALFEEARVRISGSAATSKCTKNTKLVVVFVILSAAQCYIPVFVF